MGERIWIGCCDLADSDDELRSVSCCASCHEDDDYYPGDYPMGEDEYVDGGTEIIVRTCCAMGTAFGQLGARGEEIAKAIAAKKRSEVQREKGGMDE